MEQAQLAYQDLRGKLTAGVQEARETILGDRDQMNLGQQQIGFAREAYKLSEERLRNIPETRATEVLLGLQSLSMAQLSYVSAIQSHNKAQVRLLVLLGPGALAACRPPSQVSDCQPPQIRENRMG